MARQQMVARLVSLPHDYGPIRQSIERVLDQRLDVRLLLFDHEEFRDGATLWNNPGEIDANGVDDDSNGFVDDVVGWSWLIPPYEWDFHARVDKDCEVVEFDGAALLARCEADPKFGYKLLKAFTTLMSRRLHAARRVMMENWVPAGFA